MPEYPYDRTITTCVVCLAPIALLEGHVRPFHSAVYAVKSRDGNHPGEGLTACPSDPNKPGNGWHVPAPVSSLP